MTTVTFEDFLAWLSRPAPRFECASGVVALRHTLGPPPAAGAFSALQRDLAAVSPLLARLYSQHDGAHLFEAPDSEFSDEGLHFLPVAEMPNAKPEIVEWFEQSTDDAEPKDENGWLLFYNLPEWFESAVVFARFGASAERLLVATAGPYAGKVFLFEHDPLGLRKIANSVETIFRRVITDPVKFFEEHEGNAYSGITAYETDA